MALGHRLDEFRSEVVAAVFGEDGQRIEVDLIVGGLVVHLLVDKSGAQYLVGLGHESLAELVEACTVVGHEDAGYVAVGRFGHKGVEVAVLGAVGGRQLGE